MLTIVVKNRFPPPENHAALLIVHFLFWRYSIGLPGLHPEVQYPKLLYPICYAKACARRYNASLWLQNNNSIFFFLTQRWLLTNSSSYRMSRRLCTSVSIAGGWQTDTHKNKTKKNKKETFSDPCIIIVLIAMHFTALAQYYGDPIQNLFYFLHSKTKTNKKHCYYYYK